MITNTTSLSLTSALLAAFMLISSPVLAENPVHERHELMESVGKSMKAIGKMMQDFYDAKVAEENMKIINAVPDKFKTLFPKGSDKDPKSAAAPKIWTERAGFDKILASLKADTAAAIVIAQKGEAGEAEFGGAFGKVAKNCKKCHQTYKLKKEKH